MRSSFFLLAAVAVIGLSAFTVSKSLMVEYKISDNYSIKFISKDPSGVFRGLQGKISFDENNLAASKFDVTVDVNTINTGNGIQNRHAKSDKWFDSAKYPTIRFTSSSVAKDARGNYETKGTLDMHGVQKQITIPFTFVNNTFVGSFQVNRQDFKIGDAGGAWDVYKIELSVPVTK